MTAKDLIRVRTRFVDKVSEPIIKQLLDDLLDDSVLNDAERASVLQKMKDGRDQARDLIDMVKNKGDRASGRMITHLQSRDPMLYTELGLPPAQPVEPSWPPKLLTTSDAVWSKEKKDVYDVTEHSIESRVALLITNRNFLNKDLSRYGAEKDEENMEKLLVSMRYEVVKYRDLTGKGMDDAIKKFTKHPKLKETDSVFVVISSHGKLGAVFGVNYTKEEPDEFPVDNIYKRLGTSKCPALFNKPKIIIIQACRGEGKGAVLLGGLVSNNLAGSGPAQQYIVDDALQYVHEERDFLTLLSSTPDTKAYRHIESGSLLFQYIVEVFKTSSPKDDIEELFRKVMQCFEDASLGVKLQMPTKDRCSLMKRFYPIPGQGRI